MHCDLKIRWNSTRAVVGVWAVSNVCTQIVPHPLEVKSISSCCDRNASCVGNAIRDREDNTEPNTSAQKVVRQEGGGVYPADNQ